jgi:hypothetical protein
MPDDTPNTEVDRNMTSSQREARTLSRWAAPAALVLALIAIGLAIWSLMRPAEGAAVNAQPSDDAKARVCVAFDTVRKAVSLQTNADVGRDPVAKEAVAANARLATLGGGQYLLSLLDPGTPSELADAVRSFANDLQDVGMNQLAGVSGQDPTQAARLSRAQADSTQIADKCK